MTKEIKSKSANEILNESYVEISKYVAETRAYTSMIDGFKAVYRRLLYASRNIKGKSKAMEFIAAALVYHPHGDGGCAEALVNMTCEYNPLPLFKGYGNFGGCGFGSAAPRYLSAELNEIGKLMYLELVEYADYSEGDSGELEPRYLPSLIPYALIVGSKGMTVGLPTPNIPSFNLLELIQYFKSKLLGIDEKYPMPDVGKARVYGRNVHDIAALYSKGICKVEYQSVINYDDPIIEVDSFPPNTKMWGMRDHLKSYIDQRVVEYSDSTSKEGIVHQYELINSKELSMQSLISKFDDRSWSSESYRMYFEKDGNIYTCSFDKIVDECLSYLKKCAIRKFEHDIKVLKRKMEVIEVLELFKDKYSKFSLGEIKRQPASYYKNEMMKWGYSAEVASQAWSKSITYITSDHNSELPEMEKELRYCESMKDNPTDYLLSLYDRLLELVTPIYKSKTHSEWYYPTEDGSDLGYVVNKTNQIEIGRGRKFVKYKKYIYGLSRDGIVYKIDIPKILGATYRLKEDIVSVKESDEKSKYIVLQSENSVVAFDLSACISEENYLAKVSGTDYFSNLYIVPTDKVKIFYYDDTSEILNIEDLFRDRTGSKRLIPSFWSKKKIKEVINCKGD